MSTPPADNGSYQFLTNDFGDHYLHEVNRDAFNHIGSDAVFRRQYGEKLWREDSLNVIAGTDSGLLVRYVLKHGLPDGSRFLFVELPELLPLVRQQLADLEPDRRLAIITSEELKDQVEPFNFQDYAYLGNIETVQSLGVLDAYLPDYRTLYWDTKKEVDAFVWQVNFQTGSQVFVQRQIENLAENRIPAADLKDKFKGYTAVLLGGGPSLDEVLPWVKENRDKLVILAVSRVCRRLLDMDIQPHIVVSIDPHPVSFDVSKELLRFQRGTVLVNSYHVTPLLLGQWHGGNAYIAQRFPWQTKLNVSNLSNQGPTVTNTTLHIAVELGCERVILAGVDLCYDRCGNTHAAGSNERNAGPLLGNVGIQVETNGGWMADTRHSFSMAVDIMGGQAAQALERGCALINPAEGAARIPNVQFQPLDQIPLSAPPEKADQRLHSLIPDADADAEQRLTHYRQIQKELSRVNGRLRTMRRLTEDALHCNDGLFGRNGIKKDFKYKKKMDKIEKRLDREFKDLAPLVKSYGTRAFIRLVRPDREKEWTDDDIENWGRGYYQAYQASVDHLLESVEAAQNRTRSRIEDEKPKPDFDRLNKQWENDQQPGRALLWKERHPDAYADLPDATRQRLQTLIQRFTDILDAKDTAQAEWCRQEYNLGPVRSKALILFQNEETDELAHLISELEKQTGEEAEELTHLGKGYLLELRDDEAAAIDQYTELVNRALEKVNAQAEDQRYSNPRLEDALRRMSAITLQHQDSQNALLVLDILSALSPIYEPQYAEMLRISGDVDQALDIYTDYLKKAPNDLGVMLRMGRLYRDTGALEPARWAFNYVLEKDPQNQAAKTLLEETGAAS